MDVDYQAFFHAVSAPCAVLDVNFCYVECNQTYLDTLMRVRSDLIGRYLFDVFPEREEREEQLKKMFQSSLDGNYESLPEFAYSIDIPEADGGGKTEIWWRVHTNPVPVPSGSAPMFALRVENVTTEIEARQLAETIAGELQHRVGNLLNVVLTIARQSALNAHDIKSFLDGFSARILSLAKTHKALTGGNWDGITLRHLAEQQLEAYTADIDGKVSIQGGDLKLSAMEAQAIAMALHELATNALKYGALRQPDGKLHITWKSTGTSGYEIEWHESGLTGLKEPEKLGFGSLIITRILPSQLNGEAVREFTPNSHLYRLSVPERQTWKQAD